jgi:chemosensory pili system protein ChpA (sensor histidine kinase/response regulator)
MSQSLDPEVLRGFLEEALGYLPGMRRCLSALRQSARDTAACEELHRLVHCVTGASRVIGMDALGEAAHAVETLLEPAAAGEIQMDESLLELVEAGVLRMERELEQAPRPQAAPAIQEPNLDNIPSDLLSAFLQEADECLQLAGRQMRDLEQHTGDRKPMLREFRRGIHTIKGAAGMLGLETLASLAHRMEDLLDLLFEGRLEYSPDRHQLLAFTYDTLCDLVRQKGRVAGLAPQVQELLSVYDLAVNDLAEAPPEPELPAEPAEPTPTPLAETESSESSRVVRAPLERLDDLVRIVGELFVNRSAFERHLASYARGVEELSLSLQRIRRLTAQFDAEHVSFAPSESGTVPRLQPTQFGAEFDALEFDRYTQLNLLSRELTETTNDLSTAGSQLQQLIGSFDGYVNMQGRLTSELQDKLVRLRMVPLSLLANRMHRTVRVASQKSGKPADLILTGLDAELDKSVVEQLAAPFDHLLRNAVDHGMESAEQRRAAGKPDTGVIRLTARQQGTQVVIELADDGAGLDPEKIRETAVRLGFLTEAEAAAATHEHLFALVFESGFSTAESVSELSGRGVGLDVVKSSVEALKGTVTLQSLPGRGTVCSVRIPTTLAITKVLFLEEQQETYAIPLAAVSQVARVDAAQIEAVGQKPVVRLGQTLIPLLRLSDSLHSPQTPSPVSGRQPLLVLRAGQDEFALAVDRIVGAREVIVKPLSGVLRRSPAVAGATLLGDGSVVLILNPEALSPAWQQARQARGHLAARAANAQQRPLNVLIVDDSLSVRRVVANLVRNNGWVPIQAKDGLEALEMLQGGANKPDVILMDIEMPRMDGFELTATLRSQPEFRGTPIVMLTSRAGDKHRSKAFSLGATHYLVKPYQDETLLTILRNTAQGGFTRVA